MITIPCEVFSSTKPAKPESSQVSPSLSVLQYPVHMTEPSWRPTRVLLQHCSVASSKKAREITKQIK